MLSTLNLPLVTCIMPTGDRRAFAPRAIDYFLRQDYPNTELLIVDDGDEPIADLAPNDRRVRYVRLNGRSSVGAKRNLACEQARGAIIAHWDDDDWHAPQRLSYQVEALLRAGADLCGINQMLFYDLRDGRAWRYVYPSRWALWLSGSTLCYTRAFWAANRFAHVNVGEDARFVAAARPERVLVLPESSFHVGMIHGRNVSPKQIGGACWQPYPADEIQRLLGDDWSRYRLELAASHPANAVPPVPREVPMLHEIAVIVTCHEPYLPWLPETLASIDRQSPLPAERIVAFDRCAPSQPLPPGWRAIHGEWGHPAGARNTAMAQTQTPWLIFWDADNVMPEGYTAAVQQMVMAASADLAIIYPDIQYCDERLRPIRLWTMPQWDYWRMRAENCVDTSAAWRREAVELVGGWTVDTGGSFEDYALALDITGAGWRATRLNGPPILMRVHTASRMQMSWNTNGALTNLWRARSLAIVSLLAGRDDVFERWAHFLMHAELPRKTALYIIENSGRPEFARRVHEMSQQIAEARKLSHLDVSVVGSAYRSAASEPYFVRERHLHVARLYASVLPRVHEDLVLTLEDDVEPPLDAIRRLGEEVGIPSRLNVGGVAAAYALPQDSNFVCAGTGTDSWGQCIPWHRLPREPIDVGCVGGGCTIWPNWVLKSLPIHFWWNKGLGWDGALCMELRRQGYRVRLHGAIQCQHHLHGRVLQPHSRVS